MSPEPTVTLKPIGLKLRTAESHGRRREEEEDGGAVEGETEAHDNL